LECFLKALNFQSRHFSEHRCSFCSSLCASKELFGPKKRQRGETREDYTVRSFITCDSSVGIALGYGLEDRGSRVRFPTGTGNFSLHHRVQNGSGAHPASYPTGTKATYTGGKADHSPPSSTEVKECVELHLHSPNTPPWRGA
jgi:hypothetical protein